LNKATLGGYRHLLRKARPETGTPDDGNAALAELRTILDVTLGQHWNGELLEPTLGRILVLATAAGDGLKMDPRSESLWPTRLDVDAGSSSSRKDAWMFLGEKLCNEPATTALSLVRIIHATAHLATSSGSSLKNVAATSLTAD
jgi:hypothetical protein